MGAVAGLGVLAFAHVRSSEALDGYAKALNGAKSLSAGYTVQVIGGAVDEYKLDLAKPNKARIDTPTQLIIADGTTITTYDKGDKTYYKTPQTDSDLKKLFADDSLNLFGSFFDAQFYSKVVSAKAAGTKTMKGVAYNLVQATMDDKGKKTVTFYLDPADNLAKVGEFVLVDAGAKDTTVVKTKDLTVDKDQPATTFAFAPPEGSKELSYEEMNAGKWYDNIEEAESMAKKTNKPIFVDFYADW
jgi:outer membrane lipoprotein-sorting protein